MNRRRSVRRNVNFKLYFGIIFSVLLLIFLYFIFISQPKTHKTISHIKAIPNQIRFSEHETESIIKTMNLEKIVHLDLKGAPPKISYFKKLFPLLDNLGATGILIEYEDMFPYQGALLGNVSALNAYTLDDIKMINELAKQSGLKIIPLVQTFGHLEFLLKLKQFIDYREFPIYPQVICPTYENTLNLLKDMINQVVMAHPNSEMIHIGADEVWFLGICDRCTSFMSKNSLSKSMLFIEHVKAVTNLIKKEHPHLRILIWDDEFRSINLKELKSSGLDVSSIEPVVWKYTKDVYEELGPSLWHTYRKVFPKVWAASAFKGATGSNQFLTDTTHHLENHRSWVQTISNYKESIIFEGIILTGWQRYDHFAVLCELLPVGIPSLAMSLRILMGYKDSSLTAPTEVAKLLKCDQPWALLGPVFGSPKCLYPGGQILENVYKLQQIKQELNGLLDTSKVRGWFDEYNIRHSFTNTYYVKTAFVHLGKIRKELRDLDKEIADSLNEIYDSYTVEEWKETYLQPVVEKVEGLWKAKENALNKEYWPRRPLKDLEDL